MNEPNYNKMTKEALVKELTETKLNYKAVQELCEQRYQRIKNLMHQVNTLNEEIKTANEALAAKDKYISEMRLTIINLSRAIRIIKATVNGFLFNNEDEIEKENTIKAN